MNFFVCYPFFNTKLTVHSELYQQYLLLRKITNLLMSPVIRTNELPEFERDVQAYIDLNERTGQSLTPKIHHLLHYSMLIREFGPLMNYSTLRFERAHQIGKNSIANSRCARNIPLQIATAYSKSMANQLEKTVHDQMVIAPEYTNLLFPQEFSRFVDMNEELILIGETSIEANKIQAGHLYLAQPTDDTQYRYPIFFFVEYIVKQNSSIKILGNFARTVTFDKSKYAFLIRFNDQPDELVGNVAHFRKLFVVNHETDEQFLVKNFHINQNINYSL